MPGGGLLIAYVLPHGWTLGNHVVGERNKSESNAYERIFWGGLKEMKKKNSRLLGVTEERITVRIFFGLLRRQDRDGDFFFGLLRRGKGAQ